MQWADWTTLIASVIAMFAAIAAAIISSRTQRKVAVYSASQALALKDHEIKLSSLHRDRVGEIIKIFHLLLDLEQFMFLYLRSLNNAPTAEQKTEAYNNMFDVLDSSHTEFYRHRFYFDQRICAKIDKVFGVLHKIEQEVHGFQYSPITVYDANYSKAERERMRAKLDTAQEQMRKDLKYAIGELQEELRRLLGVTPEPQPPHPPK